MVNAVEIKLLEQRLTVKTNEDEEYTKKVAAFVDSKIHEMKDGARLASRLDVALLTAMNIADEYLKARNRLEQIELKADRLTKLIDTEGIKTA